MPCQPDVVPNVGAPIFGFRAAGAALLSNLSYETHQPAHWHPEGTRLS